jgi:DNA-binding transcriptional LysR family regulator
MSLDVIINVGLVSMVDIRQMRAFIVLAETLHFGRAAERLHLSQPPLSRQIAAMEKDLGVRLLDRHSRRAALTAAGRRFLEDARAAVDAFDLACRNVRLAESGVVGELAVGFMMHAASTVMPGLARRYLEARPQVALSLTEVVPGRLVEDLKAGRFDAGVLFDPGPTPGLILKSVYCERLCLAVPQNHRLAGRAEVSPGDLAGEAMIATAADVAPSLRDVILRYCRAGGLEPAFRLEVQLQQSMVNLVGEGLGAAFAPESMRRTSTAAVAFVDLRDAPTIDHVVAFRPDNPNPALPAFLAAAMGHPV